MEESVELTYHQLDEQIDTYYAKIVNLYYTSLISNGANEKIVNKVFSEYGKTHNKVKLLTVPGAEKEFVENKQKKQSGKKETKSQWYNYNEGHAWTDIFRRGTEKGYVYSQEIEAVVAAIKEDGTVRLLDEEDVRNFNAHSYNAVTNYDLSLLE
jgi:hypothetical protein